MSQFYLTASDEYWPQIQKFAENILIPLSQLKVKKEELMNLIKSVNYNERDNKNQIHLESLKTSITENDDGKRVKRRVNKTLKRKRAKKKKQRLRRFERKRLRMLTHARRLRRQKKSKQARLQRHYARMNMTTPKPDHYSNSTILGKEHLKNEEFTGEEADEEYESSEYEDYSEESEDSKTGSHKSGKSEDSYEDDSGDSESVSKPDHGDDDYEEYEDSDEDYEDETSEESKKKTKHKATVKSGSPKKRAN